MQVAVVRPITSETIQLAISAANGTIAITLDAEVAAEATQLTAETAAGPTLTSRGR